MADYLKQISKPKGEIVMMKKRFLAAICSLITAMSMTVPASAANTTDREYGYVSVTATNYHETGHYEKTNTSKVYVKPSQSPSGKTFVQTWCKRNGSSVNETSAGTVTLSNNQAYGITNYVYEYGDKMSNGYVSMWLKVKATSGHGWVKGDWSPDWSGVTPVIVV